MSQNHESENISASTKQYDREHLYEDHERVPIFYREITESDFQELTIEQLDECEVILKRLIANVPFSSFYSLNTLMRSFKENGSLSNSFANLIVDSVNRPTQAGLNCVGMAYELQRRLWNIGIHSYISPSHAGGLVNKQADEYADIAHSLLIVPAIVEGNKTFTAFDPGLILPRRMTFEIEGESQRMIYGDKSCRVITDKLDATFPYRIMLGADNGGANYTEAFEIKFNPNFEILNPDISITIDVMRGAIGASYIKHDEEGNRIALVDMNFLKQRVRIKTAPNTDFPEGYKNEFNFENIILGMGDEVLKKVNSSIGYLGLNLEELKTLIRHREDFMKHIYAPSVYSSLNES